jgi:hypothetical protein
LSGENSIKSKIKIKIAASSWNCWKVCNELDILEVVSSILDLS